MWRYALIVAFAVMFQLSATQAADLREMERGADNRYNVGIEGPIVRGDYAKLTAIIKRRQEFPYFVSVKSPGGDVKEAMTMGRLVRKALLVVIPSEPCNSACALIVFASMVNMDVGHDTVVGIHRPIYDPSYFAGLSFSEAHEKTRQLDREVRDYLKEMDVPTDIADQMMAVPSNEVYRLSMSAFRDHVGVNPPAVFEWLKAKCGARDPSETEDYRNADAYELYYVQMKNEDERWKAQYRDRAQLGARLSPAYRKHLRQSAEKLGACQEKAIEEERRRILSRILPRGGHVSNGSGWEVVEDIPATPPIK